MVGTSWRLVEGEAIGDCGEIEEARIEGVSESTDALEGGRGGGCMVPLVSLTRLTLSGESLVRYSATDCSG